MGVITITKTFNGANLGFEHKLWQAVYKIGKNIDVSEYKNIVLGLIFLKYISDAFMERYFLLEQDLLSDPDDKDIYITKDVIWIPKEARWDKIQKNVDNPEIGKLIYEAMNVIERSNPNLKGVFPKVYFQESTDMHSLRELIEIIGTISLYEYFLGQFAYTEGKKGTPFLTPHSVVKLLVEMIEPSKGHLFDPCCGSGEMFVHSENS